MELVSTSKDFYILRLDPGEELRDEVEKFCAGEGINAAWVNALGSCKKLELAYYDMGKKEYEMKSFLENFEITTVTGNIALKDDTPFVHIHGTFSNQAMSVIGGHINRVVVSATCEVSICLPTGDLPKGEKNKGAMGRKYDEFTGLHLLCSLN